MDTTRKALERIALAHKNLILRMRPDDRRGHFTPEQIDATLTSMDAAPQGVVEAGDAMARVLREAPTGLREIEVAAQWDAATPPISQVDQAGAIDIPHIHTVYDAVGGGYICTGCDKRFVDQGGTMSREPIAWPFDDTEPLLIQAGDDRVRLGMLRRPPRIDCRVVAEDLFQKMLEAAAPSTREKEMEEAYDALREAISITISQADHLNGVEYVAVTDLHALLNTLSDGECTHPADSIAKTAGKPDFCTNCNTEL